ncbi:MAG: hypothetical protein DRP87_02845 [Spirochaetes bacterium]|mgnify:CR=1 FL=1|nr:MAG: hypothetical protein DRP87_02845 [Spirochaetota bacterium]
MGIFDSIKKIFTSEGESKDAGKYFYIRLDRSGEIVRIRLTPEHELVPDYKQGIFSCRKVITGPESFEQAEAVFFFDERKQFTNAEISGGTLSDRESYEQQQNEER